MQGPCKGDSGGPLYVNHGTSSARRIQTLEGIISGGLACGKNTPSWYTRVSINNTKLSVLLYIHMMQ